MNELLVTLEEWMNFARPIIVPAVLVIIAIICSKVAERYIKYYAKYILFTLGFTSSLIICLPIYMLQPFHPKNMVYFSYPLEVLSKVLGLKHEIRNSEKMPGKNEGAVIVANHQSMVDTLTHIHIIYKHKVPCTFLIKKECIWVFPVGPIMWLLGLIFVDRTPGAISTRKQLVEMKRMLQDNQNIIWFYPEGTRNSTPEKLLPFKKGAFRLAIDSQAPIVPIVTCPYYFLDSKQKKFDRATTITEILDPIPTKGLTISDVDDLMNRTYAAMSKKQEELMQEFSM